MTVSRTCPKLQEQTQESLVKNYVGLVKRIAYQLLQRLPSSIQLDDLMQSGMLGLLEASRHYDDSKGASFETYASIRVRGHMLDEVRRSGWVPRSVYKNARLVATAVKAMENRLGRQPKDSEVAQELDMDLGEYYELIQDSVSSHLYGSEELEAQDYSEQGINMTFKEPHDQALQDDLRHYVHQFIDALPYNERLVLLLHYERDLNLKEIGEVLCVSESRVSQIHSKATLKIRAKMDLNHTLKKVQ